MKKTLYLFTCVLSLCLLVSVVKAGDDDEIKKHPGYVDFSSIDIPGDAEETVEISIKGPVLKFVANITRDEDRSLSRVLAQLLLIRVNTFSLDHSDTKNLHNNIKKVESKLEKDKWEKIVRVSKRDERVNIYVKMNKKDRIEGLVVMVIDDDDEAVFINIVGEADWETLDKIGRKFDIDELEDLEY